VVAATANSASIGVETGTPLRYARSAGVKTFRRGNATSMMAQYRITEDDYASANRFHAWRQPLARSLQTALIGIVTIGALLGIANFAHLTIGLVVAMGLGGAIGSAFGMFMHTSWRARRHYRQSKAVQELITAELTEAGINFSPADGAASLQWSKIFQWRQNNRFIMIYPMPILFYLVPKSIAQQGFDIPLLPQRLAEHVGPER